MLVGVLCGASLVAHASTIVLTLDSDFSKYHNYTYTDAQGNSHSEYIGPYPATLAGGPFAAGYSVFVFCHDINVDTYIGVPYDGYLVEPTSEMDILVTYIEDLVYNSGGYNADINLLAGPASMAVWELENPTSYNPAAFPPDPAAAALITQAQNAYNTGFWTAANALKYAIWMPDDPSKSQRFGIVATPEPATLLMIGSAGILFGLLIRRRRKA